MKKKITRFALLSVLPVAAVFAVVFNAYGGPAGSCPAVDPINYTVLLPDADDCSIYYACWNGMPFQMKCHDGLHFNAKMSVCDWPMSAGCVPDAHQYKWTEMSCNYLCGYWARTSFWNEETKKWENGLKWETKEEGGTKCLMGEAQCDPDIPCANGTEVS